MTEAIYVEGTVRPDEESVTGMSEAIETDTTETETAPFPTKVKANNVDAFYAEKQALFGVSLDVPENQVTALIGPSGCGKSTFLRCINRMNDTIPICRVTGDITIDEQDIYDPAIDVVQLRARVGMVFQKPNPFPKSIYENVAYGQRTSMISSNRACSVPACGTRSRIAWVNPAPVSRADSSNAFASPGPSR